MSKSILDKVRERRKVPKDDSFMDEARLRAMREHTEDYIVDLFEEFKEEAQEEIKADGARAVSKLRPDIRKAAEWAVEGHMNELKKDFQNRIDILIAETKSAALNIIKDELREFEGNIFSAKKDLQLLDKNIQENVSQIKSFMKKSENITYTLKLFKKH